MDRRTVLASLGLYILAPRLAQAQPPPEPWRIGVLGLTPWPPSLSAAFKQGLGDRGYVERPTTFELAINRVTAKTLGLTMPAALVSRADRLVE